MKLPQKLLEMTPYDPTENRYPVKLDANESFFPIPQPVRQRILRAVEGLDFNRYPDPNCTRLRAAAAGAFGVQAENLMAGNGSDELISLIVSAFVPKGGTLMVIEPDFSMYRFYAQLCEVSVLSHEKAHDFRVTPQKILEKAARQRPDVLIFSNPCNPAGQGFTREEIRLLLKNLPETLVVVDEAYMDFWDQSMLPEIETYENLMILRTMSKAYAMAGIRLGFAAARKELIEQFNKCRSPFNVSSLTQAAGTAALQDTSWALGQISQILENKRLLQEQLSSLAEQTGAFQVLESHTNFVLVRTGRCSELYQGLLERGICVRNFERLSLLRITAGSREENARLLEALGEVLCPLKA